MNDDVRASVSHAATGTTTATTAATATARATVTTNVAGDAATLRDAIARAKVALTDRDSLIEVLVLAAIAGEHVLVVGPPGTAKSQAVRRVAAELGGNYFEYLLGRFTEPNEIFGPIDLQRLREGVVEVSTRSMLPEADVAFLDEVFLGSTAILNTLLGILNERRFRRGSTVVDVPLRLCVGASNSLPTDVSLAAFADRFLVRVFLDPVPDPSLEELLQVGWEGQREIIRTPTNSVLPDIGVVDRLREQRLNVDLAPIRPVVASAIRRLRSAGIPITDRRAVRCQSLVAAAAVLDGRSVATVADLWPLPLIVADAESQPVAREALAEFLEESANSLLPNAAEELSAGPAARAARLVINANDLLGRVVTPIGRDDRLRVEALLREIDASFSAESMPEDLANVRAQMISMIA